MKGFTTQPRPYAYSNQPCQLASCLMFNLLCFLLFLTCFVRTNVTQIALFHFSKICSKNIQSCCFIELFFVESQTVQSLANTPPEGKRVTEKKTTWKKTAARGESPQTSNNQNASDHAIGRMQKRSVMKYFSQLNQCYKHLVPRRGTSSCQTSSAKASGSWHPRCHGKIFRNISRERKNSRKKKR